MNCGHEHHKHDHDKEIDRGQAFSMYKYIDTTKVTCLNESGKGQAASIFKPWDQRTDQTKFLESEDDHELLIFIPFTGSIKLKITSKGGDKGTSPKKVKAFINREDLDFSNISGAKSVQEFDVVEDFKGEMEYPTKIVKFNNVSNLTLYISDNFGAEKTRVYYIGLKGDYSPPYKREAVITAYESKPQLKDHQLPSDVTGSKNVQ